MFNYLQCRLRFRAGRFLVGGFGHLNSIGASAANDVCSIRLSRANDVGSVLIQQCQVTEGIKIPRGVLICFK